MVEGRFDFTNMLCPLRRNCAVAGFSRGSLLVHATSVSVLFVIELPAIEPELSLGLHHVQKEYFELLHMVKSG